MCTKHPKYKAIRKPKKLKATGEVCPECLAIYLAKGKVFILNNVGE